jgi:murein L,D-transpeptidase YcbB/YkuD
MIARSKGMKIVNLALPCLAVLSLISACGPSNTTEADLYKTEPEAVRVNVLREAAAGDDQVTAFYEARDWSPGWNDGSARELSRALEGAWTHGIDPEYFIREISVRNASQREAALTKIALNYADALSNGMADPNEIFGIYAVEMNEADLTAGLTQALETGRIAAWLNSLAPQDDEYQALSAAYLRFRELSERDELAPIPDGEAIEPGDSDPRIPALAARLRADGYLRGDGRAAAGEGQDGETAQDSANLYTERLVEAVKAFQREQGITDDGVVGPDTVAVLSAGPGDRARQLALNLEARRWLPRDPSPDRIDVNLPAAQLTWYRDGRVADVRRVIVGSPANPTPHLANAFDQLVVNPPWNVPESIAAEEILPKGPQYLQANDMYVEDGRVVQRPGPQAALGAVKFDMQNPHAIYLHDTPAKTLFDQNERYLSHGCVRVEDAVGFARMIASAYGDAGEFNRLLASGQTSELDLNREVPVRLLYHTAFVDTGGQVAFRPDMYGFDARLAEALGIPAPEARSVSASEAVGIGP